MIAHVAASFSALGEVAACWGVSEGMTAVVAATFSAVGGVAVCWGAGFLGERGFCEVPEIGLLTDDVFAVLDVWEGGSESSVMNELEDGCSGI